MEIERYWEAVLHQDANEMRTYLHPDAKINWYCTNEQFNVEEFIRVNCEYPGDWDGEIEQCFHFADKIITATHVVSKTGIVSCHVVSVFTIKDDKIVWVDEYWGDDGEAPKWRKDLHIGQKINRATN